MVEKFNVQPLSGKILNMSSHYSLFREQDLYYMLNGDIQGNEDSNKDYFAQNALANELCVDFPSNYTLIGTCQLDKSNYVLFFVIGFNENSEIGLLNTDTCIYNSLISAEEDPTNCLNFKLNTPVRSVYKFNNSENDRRIYFIDGINPNRYLDVDKASLGEFPQTYIGNKCLDCGVTDTGFLDCDALRINKCISPPCISINRKEEGQLLPGVYQFGIAYGEDNLVYTDYYFSQPFKAFSEVSNLSFELEIGCTENPFKQYSLIAVSQTRENGLVVYNLGFYDFSTTKFVVANFENANILDTSVALLKRTIYDYSEHIATNGETLLLGHHKVEDPLNYQPQANNITVRWKEIKVKKEDAYMYPSFMRDEVYAIGIEWFDKKGKSLGVFHIPGRTATEGEVLPAPSANDIYEIEDCATPNLKVWEIENTASITDTYIIDCEDCTGDIISQEGLTAYWETKNLTYPDDSDVWGNLVCQKIRHHKMPANDLTHTNSDFTYQIYPSGCETVQILDPETGLVIREKEFCYPSGYTQVVEEGCVNILAIGVSGITHPLVNAIPYDNVGGYRIVVGDRKGNKSILHKGLIFNMWKEQSTDNLTAYYPNYPFNDLHDDVFLTEEQGLDHLNYLNQDQSPTNIVDRANIQRDRFTYHSPDIHFRETRQEFGTEMKIYGEQVGWIEGTFSNFYLHPQTRLGKGSIQTKPYEYHAAQAESICHYGKWTPWNVPFRSRFKIDSSQYLLPINQVTSDNTKIFNYLRETSYYLKTNRDVRDPLNEDVSRIVGTDLLNYPQYYDTADWPYPTYNSSRTVERIDVDAPSNTIEKPIQGSSYYVGVKIKQPDQYGSLETINYIPVTCIYDASPSATNYEVNIVYGGDVRISKHSFIRKMPMFTEWLSNVPITTETNYREFRNVWYPRFWYDNLTNVDDQYVLDAINNDHFGGDKISHGKFYIFVAGVVEFWCESEFVGDFRERDFTPNGTFYPKAGYKDVLRGDKLPLDNKYLYNFSMLNTNIERVKQDLTPTESDADFVVTYSQKNDVQSAGDPWLQFLPLNYTILPRTYGRFTGIHPTDMYNVMFAFEDAILYSQINFSITTGEGSNILLGQGDIFTNRLLKLSNEKTGYAGSLDPNSFINTRFGTFFLDRKRKKLFRWNGQLTEVGKDFTPWFQNYIANDAGTNYNNSAIITFDNFTENLYITEKQGRERWTVSYKPKRDGIISFHSFTPDFYLDNHNTYLSYHKSKSNGIWKHNDKYNYQSYYGQAYPFDIGIVINNQFQTSELQSVELFSEWLKIQDFGEVVYTNNFFDKVFAYNNKGTTGLRTVLLKNRDNPKDSQIQNKETSLITEVTQIDDSIYRFNKFESLLLDPNQPVISWADSGMTYTPVNIDINKNPRLRDDIKGKWIKLHLIATSNTDHKILVQLIAPNTDKIIV